MKIAYFWLGTSKAKESGPPTPSSATLPRSPAARGSRTPRTPRRLDAQPTRLEALDDDLGPLGPLGDNAPAAESAPTPPSKEPLPIRNARQSAESRATSTETGDELIQGVRPRFPPPVQPPSSAETARRQGQASMSVEQAAKPSFNVTVGDPHKVGDLTTSHIVYQVRTKVYAAPRILCHTNNVRYRQLPKLTSSPNSPSADDIEIFFGSIRVFIITIQGSLFHHRRKSRP